MSSDVNLKPPNTRTLSWDALVRKAWGDEWLSKNVSYEFSNSRKFYEYPNTGFYRATILGYRVTEDSVDRITEEGLLRVLES